MRAVAAQLLYRSDMQLLWQLCDMRGCYRDMSASLVSHEHLRCNEVLIAGL